MITVTSKKNCSGCHACFSACPKQCITMKADAEGFLYPSINSEKCADCGLCEKACPILNKSEEAENQPAAYAAINKDEAVRAKSSSGGVFTLLAEQIINAGGVVFGAALSEDCKSVSHIAVESAKELDKLRGSKYLQSEIGEVYIKAKEYLESGREVLFTGTPCQIGGLRAYLKKDYDNLFTQDVICHGAPSPLVWEKYADFREAEAAAKLRRTFFRHKKYGWKTYSVLLEFSNNTEYKQTLKEDLFLRGFLANLYLRPSCHDCMFKGLARQSDITLADFWGIQNILPEFDDDKGASLVLVNSEKGKALFESAADKMKIAEVDVNEAIKYNSAAVRSADRNEKRARFMRDMQSKPIDGVIEKYTKKTLASKLKGKLRRGMKKIKRALAK